MIDVITVDLDGIFTDLHLFQNWMIYDYHTKRGLEVPKIRNPFGYDIFEQYEISKNLRDIMWLEYYPIYCKYCKPREAVFEILKSWQEQGKKVPLVTGRAFATTPIVKNWVKKWTTEWLGESDFIPDEIVWVPEKDSGLYKAKACVDLNSKLMIDDKASNFDNLLEVVDTICLNIMWNILYEANNKPYELYRANKWNQIREIVEVLDTNNKNEIKKLISRNKIMLTEHEEMQKKIELPPKKLLLEKDNKASTRERYFEFSRRDKNV